MLCLTLGGWAIFRAPSLGWLIRIVAGGFQWGWSGDSLTVGLVVLVSLGMYGLPLLLLALAERVTPQHRIVRSLVYSLTPVLILALAPDSVSDFIYFQF